MLIHRLPALAAAIWLFIAASRLPLNVEAVAEIEEGDHPCAYHKCGCRSLDDCLSGCCCFPSLNEAYRAMASLKRAGARPVRTVESGTALRCAGGRSDAAAVAAFPVSMPTAHDEPEQIAPIGFLSRPADAPSGRVEAIPPDKVPIG
jgi:hypothetical protein